jgi:hypothetical protein
VCSATNYFAEQSSAEPNSPVYETEGSEIYRTSNEMSKTMTTGLDDWRTPLVHYLENPGHIADIKIRRQALKYVMLDNTLYHQTMEVYCLNAWVQINLR